MNTIFKKGQRVTIYQDPITEHKEEGKAVLIELRESNYKLEYWTVRFTGEQRYVQRSISTVGKNAEKKEDAKQ